MEPKFKIGQSVYWDNREAEITGIGEHDDHEDVLVYDVRLLDPTEEEIAMQATERWGYENQISETPRDVFGLNWL